ncbi:MAG: rhodanese-like domain-containing protein [Bacteroidia bacterium]|nr:rhodanese-like domain-containing protein [Bacteroidia bacterium]MDW8347639.1 rhodanese-like domain-containing protein [Bacteroidia bacterium]
MNVKEINYTTLQEWQKDSKIIQLVDVRTLEERNRFNIGGIHIPISEFYTKATRMLDKQIPVVLYCHSGIRSLNAAEYLLENGYTEVYHLKKGILGIDK